MKSLIVGLLLTAVVAGKPQVDFSKLGQTLTDAAENLGEGAAQAAGDVGETLAQAREEIEGLVEQAVQNAPNFPPFPIPGFPGAGGPPGIGGPPGAPGSLPWDFATLQGHLRNLSTICSGEAPLSCSCFYREDAPIEPPFDDPLDVADCTPDVCECADGTTPKANRPLAFFARPVVQIYKLKTKSACGGEIKSCKCKFGDQPEMPIPWGTESEFLNCNPTECTCEDDSVVEVPEPEPPQFVKDMLEQRNRKLKFMCDGELPDQCTCANQATVGHWNPTGDGNYVRQLFCNPAICTCPSGDTFKYPRPERPEIPAEVRREVETTLCGGDTKLKPTECKCEVDDGRVVKPPFSPNKLMRCRPTECQCVAEGSEESQSVKVDLVHASLTLASPIGRLNKMCDDKPPKECSCLKNDGVIRGPFTASRLFSIVLGCGPNKCTCEDGTVWKTPVPIRPILDLKDLCDGEFPESCQCEDPSSTMTSFSVAEILPAMKDCKPVTCKCKGSDEEKPFQGLGCTQGGAPNCKDENGEKGKLICDGKVLTVSKLAAAKLSGECVCENGIKPVCSNTEKTPKCLDGSDPDPNISGVQQQHLKKCKNP